MNKNILLLVCTILFFGVFVQSNANATIKGANATAYIVETIDVTLSYPEGGGGINFPDLTPGTNNNSANATLRISINPTTNVQTNIAMKADDNFNSSGNILYIDNLTYNNMSLGASTFENNVSMTTGYSAPPFPDWIGIPKPTGSAATRNSSFYLTVPGAQVAGTYTTNININVTRYTP